MSGFLLHSNYFHLNLVRRQIENEGTSFLGSAQYRNRGIVQIHDFLYNCES